MNNPINAPEPPRRLRCFIVEDSAIILRNLIDTLEQVLPLEVIGTAVDEPGALAWLGQRPLGGELMILDLFLKQGTGLNVLAMAQKDTSTLRKVVLTNYATPDIRRRCLSLGADRVFDKSSELEELIAYCGELVDALGADGDVSSSGDGAH
jgi:DNA-binding NarL/FixJ family response regulator